MTPTVRGVRKATEDERRYTITCIHNAKPGDESMLVKMLSGKTPREMYTMLKSSDVNVTNRKDKDKMLPIVKETDDHVKEIMRSVSRPHERASHAPSDLALDIVSSSATQRHTM